MLDRKRCFSPLLDFIMKMCLDSRLSCGGALGSIREQKSSGSTVIDILGVLGVELGVGQYLGKIKQNVDIHKFL